MSAICLQYVCNMSVICLQCLQYVCNMSAICLQYVCNMSAMSAICLQYVCNMSAICLQYVYNVCNMSAICLQYVYNMSAISVMSATSTKPMKLHQFSPQRYQSRSPPLAKPMTIFHARHGKSLLARLPLAPWRPSRHVSLHYP